MIELTQVREGLREIDIAVHNVWTLGKNMIVGWIPDEDGIRVCFAPVHRVLGEATSNPRLLDGGRRMDRRTFTTACKTLQARPLHLPLPFKIGDKPGELDPEAVDSIIRRYSIVRTGHRAVMLFDVVGFAAATPLEQLAQFTSLESSISGAGETLGELGIGVELARSTAGDGYMYVWNRAEGLEADLRTYAAFLLTLFDNALAWQQAGPDSKLVPRLRASFTVGSHYSYHQVEGTKPRSFEYATGQVTITLARMTQKALPGQVLVGSFQRPVEGSKSVLDTVLFLARTDKLLLRLNGAEIGEKPVSEIRSIVTGGTIAGRTQSVVKYAITDKHGNRYDGFNLRIRLQRAGAAPLTLGLAPEALSAFDASASVYEIALAEKAAAASPAG
jgi:class 3 adenylate cyclase